MESYRYGDRVTVLIAPEFGYATGYVVTQHLIEPLVMVHLDAAVPVWDAVAKRWTERVELWFPVASVETETPARDVDSAARAYRFDYPALDSRPVTEGHARYCAEHGHATHTVDGKDVGLCPRCGEVKPDVAEAIHLAGARSQAFRQALRDAL